MDRQRELAEALESVGVAAYLSHAMVRTYGGANVLCTRCDVSDIDEALTENCLPLPLPELVEAGETWFRKENPGCAKIEIEWPGTWVIEWYGSTGLRLVLVQSTARHDAEATALIHLIRKIGKENGHEKAD